MRPPRLWSCASYKSGTAIRDALGVNGDIAPLKKQEAIVVAPEFDTLALQVRAAFVPPIVGTIAAYAAWFVLATYPASFIVFCVTTVACAVTVVASNAVPKKKKAKKLRATAYVGPGPEHFRVADIAWQSMKTGNEYFKCPKCGTRIPRIIVNRARFDEPHVWCHHKRCGLQFVLGSHWITAANRGYRTRLVFEACHKKHRWLGSVW